MNATPTPNALAARIADFLSKFPPFSYLMRDELLLLSQEVIVKYIPIQETVFDQGQESLTHFFLVRKGSIRLFRTDVQSVLVDQLDEGDIFGIRPLIAKQAYAVSARANEESLLYAIPLSQFEPIIDANTRVARFLATSFAAGQRNPERSNGTGTVLVENDVALSRTTIQRQDLAELARVPVSRKAVTCKREETVKTAAMRMTKSGVGSMVIVDDLEKPIGIITDRDLRKNIATGLYAGTVEVSKIMQSPVITIAPDQTVVDVQLVMVKHSVHHLVVTTDGSPNGKVLGVLSNRDLLVALGSSPAAVVREIQLANKAEEVRLLRSKAEQWLSTIVEQRGSVYAAAKIMSEVNDQITKRFIELSLQQMNVEGIESPPLAFCWISLGSQGRGEQLLRTDQDHAIVVANGSDELVEQSKNFYVELANRVSIHLARVGYDQCVGDMMASNPAWCMTIDEWSVQVAAWSSSPSGENLLNASTLLDRRPLYGDLQLGEELTELTTNTLSSQPLFLAFLAKAAIDNPPPLSFFRSFVVERSGEHKDEFDIKQRAMLPLADAARVLTLSLHIPDPTNTIDRFDRLREKEPQNADMYQAAAQAYDTLMQLRARQGLSDGSEGRYFKINEISKLERLQLRNTFKPIAEVLASLKLRFQLNMLTQ